MSAASYSTPFVSAHLGLQSFAFATRETKRSKQANESQWIHLIRGFEDYRNSYWIRTQKRESQNGEYDPDLDLRHGYESRSSYQDGARRDCMS